MAPSRTPTRAFPYRVPGPAPYRDLSGSCESSLGPRRWPRFAIAPWMRVYPQLGFSVAILTTNAASSAPVRGRPGLRRSMKVHLRATSSRCQRNNVSGVTIVPSSRSVLHPTALAFFARFRRSASMKMMRDRPIARGAHDSLHPVTRSRLPVGTATNRRPQSAGIAAESSRESSHANVRCSLLQRQP
jgi:hypothetical protein